MHPADEYALIAAEIRRLKTRQSSLREQVISDVRARMSNQHEVKVQNAKRRVFLREKLPRCILDDANYWEIRESPRVTVKDISSMAPTPTTLHRSEADEDDIVLVEDG